MRGIKNGLLAIAEMGLWTWSSVDQGSTNFAKMWELLWSSGCQKGDMKQGPINIRHHHTKFSCSGDLACGNCAHQQSSMIGGNSSCSKNSQFTKQECKTLCVTSEVFLLKIWQSVNRLCHFGLLKSGKSLYISLLNVFAMPILSWPSHCNVITLYGVKRMPMAYFILSCCCRM